LCGGRAFSSSMRLKQSPTFVTAGYFVKVDLCRSRIEPEAPKNKKVQSGNNFSVL
jgi:hypothetical protein